MDGSIGAAEPGSPASGRSDLGKPTGLTPEGRHRLREAALANRPWEHATGPRTAEGKARSAANGFAEREPGFPRLDPRGVFDSYAEIISELARLKALAILHRGLRPATEPIGASEPFENPFR